MLYSFVTDTLPSIHLCEHVLCFPCSLIPPVFEVHLSFRHFWGEGWLKIDPITILIAAE